MSGPMRYANYKDSGVEWLGEIPAEWKISTIGSLYDLRNEKVSDKDFEPLSVTMKGILPQLATAAKTDDGDNRKLVRKGDFVINGRSDRRGSCGISPYNGSVSLINIVLEPRSEMDAKFYDWLFHSEMFSDEFYKWGRGIVDDLWTTRWSEMKRIIIPVPPLAQQKNLSSYLDSQCAEIDDIIASARASIEEYKAWRASVIYEAVTKGLNPDVEMKDSGVEWLGEVPTDWIETKIKHVAQMNPPLCREVRADAPVSYAPMECIKIGYMTPRTILPTDIPTGLTRFEDGDIVLAKVTPCFENGNIAIANNMEQGVGYGSSELFVFRPTQINQRFLFYYLQNLGLKAACVSTMTGTGGLKRVSSSFINNATIYYPEELEQAAIVAYLDAQCSTIAPLINEKEALISDLENYKKSLIYEVVTGKRRVYDR